MDATAADVDGSEFDAVGIERAPARSVAPPRVADAAACLECVVIDSLAINDRPVVFGEVVHVFVDDALLNDGKVDTRTVDAVGRLGGPNYTRIDRLEFTRQH